eukprot:8975510-Ditylum_brightwellii.AAC.1
MRSQAPTTDFKRAFYLSTLRAITTACFIDVIMSKLVLGAVTGVTLPSAITAGRGVPTAFSVLMGRTPPFERRLICNPTERSAAFPYRFSSSTMTSTSPSILVNGKLGRAGIFDRSKCATCSLVSLGAIRGKSSNADWGGKEQKEPCISSDDPYVLRFNGKTVSKMGVVGAGAVLYDAREGLEVWAQGHKIGGTATHNEATYRALIFGLTRALELGVRNVVVQGDSELIMKQMRGENKVKSEKLKP